MSPEQIAIVRESWRKIAPIADQAVSLFYDKLFEIDPDLRELFKGTDMVAQRMKLVQALAGVIGRLEGVEEIVPQLQELGRRHTAYGVQDEHYASVGIALLGTLEEGLAEDWTPEAGQAWAEAYGLIAGTMKAAA
ncbi:globin family protein [Pelagibius sp. Alg239-R121]|uniref:globin family protein n=1 Tax=Pelagibius sp. Alg239-R121 TaxID=2993448 RepID=UPI0024A63453|nr:globin family protein [Pelagibius sp. Alg239-R121]